MSTVVIRPAVTVEDLLRALAEAQEGYDEDGRREFQNYLLGTLVAMLANAGRPELVLSALDSASRTRPSRVGA